MAVSHHFRLSCWCWGVCPYSGMTDCRAEWVLLVPSQWAFPASLHVFLSCGKLTIRFHMILIRPIKLDIAFSDFQGNTFPFNSSFAPASGQTILLKHTGRHRWKFLTLMFSWLQWDGAYRMLHLFCIYTAFILHLYSMQWIKPGKNHFLLLLSPVSFKARAKCLIPCFKHSRAGLQTVLPSCVQKLGATHRLQIIGIHLQNVLVGAVPTSPVVVIPASINCSWMLITCWPRVIAAIYTV